MYVDLSVPNFNQAQLHQMRRFYSLNKNSIGVPVRLKNLVIFDLKNHKKRCVFIDEKTYEFVLKTLAD
jgi:hypothetical protein